MHANRHDITYIDGVAGDLKTVDYIMDITHGVFAACVEGSEQPVLMPGSALFRATELSRVEPYCYQGDQLRIIVQARPRLLSPRHAFHLHSSAQCCVAVICTVLWSRVMQTANI